MWLTTMMLAWRNLWRSKRRTSLTLGAIALGLASLILIVNLTKGTKARLVNSATETMIGDAQIHREGYRETGEPELWMADGDVLVETVRADPRVTAASPRLFAPALAAMGDRASSLTLMGIEPTHERAITSWDEHLVAGDYPSTGNRVLIGAELADKMELEVDGKLVLTVADLETGELNSQLVRIAGLLVSENPSLNAYTVITPMPLARKLTGLESGCHEIVMTLDADLEDQAALEAILSTWSAPDRELVPWQVPMAALIGMLELQDMFLWITFAVIFLLAALGIANTMSMSILERIRELGVMQAIGTTPRELGRMILMEYIWMGFTGCLAGLALGVGFSLYFQEVGISYDNVEMMGMVMREPIYALMDWPGTLEQTLVFLVLVPVLAWFSIRKVTRIDPASALRFEG